MRKISLVLAVVLVLGVFSGSNVYAKDEGWYVAGGFLGGLVASAIINDASRPRYYYERPCYVRPVSTVRPVYYYPSYRYNTYTTTYTYTPSPYTTVYEQEVIQTW